MKKGLRLIAEGCIVEMPKIPTADLMKKGLRHCGVHDKYTESDSNRRPDEEGIKTQAMCPTASQYNYSNRRPDEEGIKTLEQPL